jgi:2-phospho-L-lactate guanylyltransferase (CobY/MobA/RfbA family)
VEDECRGQNPAAQLGIDRAMATGADSVLLLSSDLPLLDVAALEQFLASLSPGPLAVAAAALGRGGTNLLYMSPPDALGLHFGDQSLPNFERDARDRDIPFRVYDAPELALDVDEPSDLEALSQAARA